MNILKNFTIKYMIRNLKRLPFRDCILETMTRNKRNVKNTLNMKALSQITLTHVKKKIKHAQEHQ